MKTTLTIVAMCAFVATAAPAAQTKPVTIFVTSDGAMDGFTDPNKANQDTVKDLRNSLKGRKSIALVDSREAAQIVLVVMSREKAQLTVGILGDPARDVTVRVKFLYAGTETEMSGSAQGGAMMSGGAWGRAAGKVAKQVEQWIDANKAKL